MADFCVSTRVKQAFKYRKVKDCWIISWHPSCAGYAVFILKVVEFHRRGKWTSCRKRTGKAKAQGPGISSHTWEQLCSRRRSRDRRRLVEEWRVGLICESKRVPGCGECTGCEHWGTTQGLRRGCDTGMTVPGRGRGFLKCISFSMTSPIDSYLLFL